MGAAQFAAHSCRGPAWVRSDRGLTILLITHDFGIVAEMADQVAVMRNGEIVERGDVEALFAKPTHPYTAHLLASVPSL